MKPLGFLSILLLLTACEFGKKESVTTPEVVQAIPKATFVNYELNKISEKKGPCAADGKGEKCLSIEIQYPTLDSGASATVLDSINRQIQHDILNYAFISEPKDDFKLLIEEMSLEYEKILDENKDYKTGWLLEISSDIIHQDSSFISTATTIFTFTGGAHPNSMQVYRSYDLTTGKVLELGDILVEGYEEELNKLAEIEFRMDKKIPPSEPLDEQGYFFEDGQFQLNTNFAIMNKSLLFYYNAYEIGPYSMGPTELELKLTDYVDLIKPSGVIGDLKN
ncbi:DUF3298 and DUF4163 domain-containing protein [Roseivirga sp.]|uniref:DUF3298 and DUF4163 domain-containing protein n=1 Tax=Roseivirga sp. TaxID=1964215 RepID=UPI002B264B8A|nr:DUF3298 and DUF4163 domain-containing protein [Roseivirga sp.]